MLVGRYLSDTYKYKYRNEIYVALQLYLRLTLSHKAKKLLMVDGTDGRHREAVLVRS